MLINNKSGFNREKAKNAVKSTSFENLKKIEQNNGFSESIIARKNKKKIPFFHLGPNNNWKNTYNNNYQKKLNSIFSENLSKYRYLLKEGNLLIFDIDKMLNNNDSRLVIRNIKKLESEFNNLEKKIDIFIDPFQLIEYKDSLFTLGNSAKSQISIFINIDEKLINFSSSKKYTLKSFKQLDHLKNSKKLDYNLDISW